MDLTAQKQRKRETAATILQGKTEPSRKPCLTLYEYPPILMLIKPGIGANEF